jgi:N-acyl homoserine lactone hydrolase
LSAAQRLRALDAPTVVVPRSALVAGATDAGLIRIPIPAFLIEHRDGIVLFDTGLAPEAAADPRGTYGDRADRLQLRFAENQRVDRQVLAAGYRPTEVTHVVLSHLHFDHAGGTHAFPAARVMVGAGELGHARSGADRYCRAVDVSRVAACDIVEVISDTDLFGDGAVVALATPGHTPGHLSLLVRLPDRAYVLAGDAVHSRRALLDEAPFPADHDPAEAIRSIRRIKSLADRSGADIWINHEPADWARLRPRHLP